MQCRSCHREMPDTPFCPFCGTEQAPVRSKRTRGNGEGTAYKLSNNKWRAEVTLGWEAASENGEMGRRIVRTKSGFKTKKEALAYLPTLKAGPIIVQPNITFRALYDLWNESHFRNITLNTERGYKAAYKHCTTLYYLKFASLKTADLQKVVDNCTIEKGKKDDKQTIPAGWKVRKGIKTFLTCLYEYAIENDYCDKNYAKFIKLPTKPKSTRDAFTDAEIQKLWADYSAGNSFTGYILIMIYTGMRYGEISIIRKEHIYLSERYMIGGIKTEAGIDRVIPIAEKIYPIVETFYNAGNKKILEMHEKVFYNSFYLTLDRLGIRKLSPHCCRHTFATLMADAGIQPAVITETAGHEDYSTTLQYTHIPLEEKLKAVNSL